MDNLLPPLAVAPPPPPAAAEPASLLPWLIGAGVVALLILGWLLRRRLRHWWWRNRLDPVRARVIALACYRAEGRHLPPTLRRQLEQVVFAPKVSRETVEQLREVLDAL